MSQTKSYIYTVLFAASLLSCWVALGFGADKIAFHLSWSGYLPRWVEIIAQGWTLLGDGWLIVPLLVGIAIETYHKRGDVKQWRFWAAVFLALAMPQLIKLSSPDILRPWGVLPLEAIPGLDIATMKSFPSGHTAAGVFTWGYVATAFNKRWITIICVVIGMGVGWSRMALNMHWSWDVIAGALLAVFALALIDRIKTK